MPKNKSIVIYDKATGDILAVQSTPFEPVLEGWQGYIVAKCSDIKGCMVDLTTRTVKEK